MWLEIASFAELLSSSERYDGIDYDGGVINSTARCPPPGDECAPDYEWLELHENPFALAVPLQVLYTVAFAAIVLLAALDNAVVVWVVLSVRSMRNDVNIFLVNLSVADFCMNFSIYEYNMLEYMMNVFSASLST